VLAVEGRDVRALDASVTEGLVATAGTSVRLTVQSPGQPAREVTVTKEPF